MARLCPCLHVGDFPYTRKRRGGGAFSSSQYHDGAFLPACYSFPVSTRYFHVVCRGWSVRCFVHGYLFLRCQTSVWVLPGRLFSATVKRGSSKSSAVPIHVVLRTRGFCRPYITVRMCTFPSRDDAVRCSPIAMINTPAFCCSERRGPLRQQLDFTSENYDLTVRLVGLYLYIYCCCCCS